jgi:hypothetical protein
MSLYVTLLTLDLELFENKVEITSYELSHHFFRIKNRDYSKTKWRLCRVKRSVNFPTHDLRVIR